MARSKKYDGKNLCRPIDQLVERETLTAKQQSIAFRESLGYSLPTPSGTNPRPIASYDCTEALGRCYADVGLRGVLVRWSWHPAIIPFWHKHKFDLPGFLPSTDRKKEEAAFFDRLTVTEDDDYSDF